MIDKLKAYFLSVAMNKYLPMGAMAAITALGTFMAANQGILEQYGVNYITQWSTSWITSHPISGPVLLIELDTLSTKAIAEIISGLVVLIAAIQHHTTPVPPKPTEVAK